jgi:hypothetical protein
LFLTYGQDAVEMASLRCAELKATGDKAALASWRKVLRIVRSLAPQIQKRPARSIRRGRVHLFFRHLAICPSDALLFVGGVMSLTVLLERIIPLGRLDEPDDGAVFIAWGVAGSK